MDLVNKDLKSAIINMFTELKAMSKKVKGKYGNCSLNREYEKRQKNYLKELRKNYEADKYKLK